MADPLRALLRRRLGYGTVGGLLVWLTAIAVFVAFALLMAWGVSPPVD
jgi:hypothetical protein